MLTVALIVLLVTAVVLGMTTTGRPDPTFDEHTATALALLDPDHPDHPDLPRPLSFIEQVEAYLAEQAPKES